jgi:hypothetical protein
MHSATFDASLRRHIYDITLRRGSPPTIRELADSTRNADAQVLEGLRRLAAARVVVLQPASGEILMAPPFSAVPTPFVVRTAAHESYANCAWDALGVSVMTRQPAEIISACACCGDGLRLRTRIDAVPEGAGLVHFAVPARRWWDDIVFT